MDIITKKFQKCIENYKTTKDKKIKETYGFDIMTYYEFFLEEEKVFNMDAIDDLIVDLKLNDSFFNSVLKSFYDISLENSDIFTKDEYLFIKEISKFIKITPIKNNKIITDINYLNEYLKNTKFKRNMDKFFKYYNSKLSNSYYLNLINEKLIVLSDKNISTLVHEIVHGEVKECKFDEFPSIFAECSLASYYKLGDYFERIKDIKDVQKSKLQKYNKLKKFYYLQLLKYSYSLLLSIAFINNNGSDATNIDKIIEIVNANTKSNVFNLLNILNINENDIINGMNNYKKILTKD